MLSEVVQRELNDARKLGEQLGQIVASKQYSDGERDLFLIAYWDMVADFHKGIHALVKSEFYASALALARPVVESLVRAHVAVRGSPEDLARLLDDSYRTNL